jgi:hypothetical protein
MPVSPSTVLFVYATIAPVKAISRICRPGLDRDLHDALALNSIREGDRLVLFPRRVADDRSPDCAEPAPTA